MKLKHNISIRKILQALVTIVVTGGCVIAIVSASDMHSKRKVSGLDIRIKNDRYHFIDKDEVKKILLGNRHIDLHKVNLAKLNAHEMEAIIDANPWVEDAQVYIDNAQVLHIYVTQRVPVARLFDQSGNSYYLDHTLKDMPLCDRYIHYTTVVTNVPVLKDDSIGKVYKAEIVGLVKYIDRDSFWSAQISQIIVNDDHSFELVPVLGKQRILFGDTTGMKTKFNNLFAFYKKVLNRIGWDKYETLDVRYASQVVASPALPWKVPVDKAITNMNWVKSIIGETKTTESDTPMSTIVKQPVLASNTTAKEKPINHIQKSSKKPK